MICYSVKTQVSLFFASKIFCNQFNPPTHGRLNELTHLRVFWLFNLFHVFTVNSIKMDWLDLLVVVVGGRTQTQIP